MITRGAAIIWLLNSSTPENHIGVIENALDIIFYYKKAYWYFSYLLKKHLSILIKDSNYNTIIVRALC